MPINLTDSKPKYQIEKNWFLTLISHWSSAYGFIARVGICAAIVIVTILATVVFVVQGANQTWSGGASGNNTGWTAGGNWVGGAAPGSVGTTTNADIATIPATGTNPAIGIGGTTYFLGAINFTSTANRAIGASGTVGASFVLTLNGAAVNSVANTILRTSDSGTLTLQANNGQSTPNTLSLALGNATNNIVNIESSGGIVIPIVIKNGSGSKLPLGGTGTGALTLSGANT